MTTTLPTADVAFALLAGATGQYQEAKRLVTRLSLLYVAQRSREASLDAAYIVTDESDQEGCGLVSVELLDYDLDPCPLTEDERTAWDDQTTSIMWNLTEDVEDVWGEFHRSGAIQPDRLLIDDILTAAEGWDLP